MGALRAIPISLRSRAGAGMVPQHGARSFLGRWIGMPGVDGLFEAARDHLAAHGARTETFMVCALGVVGVPVQPVYLFLDERVRGAEHYWALVRGERPAQHNPWQALQPAAAGDGRRGSFRRRRLPASFFETASQQASSGPWTRHGLTQGQMEELLLMQDQGASPAELAAKFFPGQPGKLETLRRWGSADKEKIRARVREHVAAKTQAHSSCRAMAASSHIAYRKCLQLQAERPPAASSWQQELGRRFSVEGSAAAGALPDQRWSQMPFSARVSRLDAPRFLDVLLEAQELGN